MPQNLYRYAGPSPSREGHLLPGPVVGMPTWSGHPLPETPASGLSLNTQPELSSDYVSSQNINSQQKAPESVVQPLGQPLGSSSVPHYTASLALFSARQGGTLSDLPSIFWTSPTEAVNDPRHSTVGLEQCQTQTGWQRWEGKSRSQEDLRTLSDRAIRQRSYEVKVPKQDLRDMIFMFREKLLPHIPVLMTQDFQDADHLIETELPLVQCVCYVTARFLPGGRDIQRMLLPEVTELLKGNFTGGSHQLNEISTLKALVILYFYANRSSPSLQDSETSRPEEILYWPLKSLIEVYAFRLSLHKSIEDFKAELQSNKSTPISEMASYRRYTFWLQIFSMAHCCSVSSGTPPTIPLDSSIRAAPLLLREIGMAPQVRLLGEIELCLIWDQARSQQQELGEWWCPPDPSKKRDDNATESMLLKVDREIDDWYSKWGRYIHCGDVCGVVLDYLGRCARFNINSYATRYLRSSSEGLSPLQNDQVRRCTAYASDVLDWLLNLRPIQKDRFRCVCESASTMVSFCCLFIIASCQTFSSSVPNVFESLDKVTTAAQLMMDLAPDEEHNAHIQGSLILKRTRAWKAKLEQQRSHESTVTSSTISIGSGVQPADLLGRQEFTPGEFDFDLDIDGISATDPFWDFPILRTTPW